MRAVLIGLLSWTCFSGPTWAQSQTVPVEPLPETRVKLLGVKPYTYNGEVYRLDGLGVETQGRRYLMCVNQLYEITPDNEIILLTSKAAQPCPNAPMKTP